MKEKTLKTFGVIKERRTKNCTKCNMIKPRSGFYIKKKGTDWVRPECKDCTIKATTAKRKIALSGYWYVYKLKKENYIGITTDMKSRMATHKHIGKYVEDTKIIAKYKKVEFAIIHEAILHLIGYKGCHLKPDGQ